jgi:DNA repair protein RadD
LAEKKMPVELRPYQKKLVEDVRAAFRAGKRSPLIVLPTGGGKTVVFCHMVRAAYDKGLRVLILAHRVELLDQISRALTREDVPHAVVSPGYQPDRRQRVQVASVFAYVRCMDRYDEPQLIVCDECHHAIPDSTWGRILQNHHKAKVAGVTATPIRLSADGLGDIFDVMVHGPSMAELIQMGSLSRYRVFSPPEQLDLSGMRSRAGDYVRGDIEELMSKPMIVGSTVEHYKKITPGRRAVAFCVSVKHAESVAQSFRDAGISAQSIDGGMDRTLRSTMLSSFEAGDIKVITSCDIISEGFDVPAIEVVILLRPTKSLGLYLQQVGRGLRVFPGKTEAVIFDHVNAYRTHGAPDAHRVWSLAGAEKQSRGASETSVRICPVCFSPNPSIRPVCGICSHEFEVKPREVEQVEGELEEIALVAEAAKKTRIAQGTSKTRDDLIALGRSRGHASPERWADYILAGRARKKAREELARSSVKEVAARLGIR